MYRKKYEISSKVIVLRSLKKGVTEMEKIIYIDRLTQKKKKEQIYKERWIHFFYGNSFLHRFSHRWILPFITRFSFFSMLYGKFQKTSWSARKIPSFIKAFKIDSSEFLHPVSTFHSFNDFFIRKLQAEARPICQDKNKAIIPADGNYLFYPRVDQMNSFFIKGQALSLEELVKNKALAEEYAEGSMVIGRLRPFDYHRFHFPCDGTPAPSLMINGNFFSVNPLATKKHLSIFSENKRALCVFNTPLFGKILYLAIGATNVGSIQETYKSEAFYSKGEERGYFEFGGSCIILLFKKETLLFDQDLMEATQEGLEISCLLGQSMGQALKIQ